MCESKVYLIGKIAKQAIPKGNKREKLADGAILVKDEGGSVVISSLFEGKKEIKNARIMEVDAEKHVIVIRKISDEDKSG